MSEEPFEIVEFDEKAMKEFKEAMEGGTMASAVEKVKKHFMELDEVTLNIAITGRSGSGKSSFVNAIRGVEDCDEEQAAPTGVVETTMKVLSYPHPKYPNVLLWDLPGVGTENFKAETYLEKVKFDRFDFFIIIESGRFTENSVALAKRIQEKNKSLYFVRSKIDEDIRAEKRKRKDKFDQEQVLDLIRADCINGLEKLGLESPLVFLISSHELSSYDFNRLQETMTSQLPKHKRNTLLLALPNITMEIHTKKKEALRSRINYFAWLSCGVAAVPIPGLSLTADITILVTELKMYYQVFGLDQKSLEILSSQTGVPVEEFQECLKSSLNEDISFDVVMKMMSKAAGASAMVAAHTFNFLPAGCLASAPLSFYTTKYMLESCLNELANDAQRVLIRALPQSEV